MYCVTPIPIEPFNSFLSGDGDDKVFQWQVRPTEDQTGFECVKTGELEGHTESVEFIKFNHDGKLCVTGGMNNVLRVWQLESDFGQIKLKLKCKLENGPAESDDILFCEWHPKGNAILCGGKDYMLWLMNGATGDFLASLSGHEDEVLCAKFTPSGKQIVSSGNDCTIRVWSPIK